MQTKKQLTRFGIVGVLNTLIDFTILNILNLGLGVPRIPANMVSVTVAMGFSFFANKRLVFGRRGRIRGSQLALFAAVTLLGLYVLQTSVMYTLTEVWTGPLDMAVRIVGAMGLADVFSEQFVFTNGAKVVATLFTMTWNFLFYKHVVFRDEPS